MLVATYALGKLLVDWRVGLSAAAVCGSSLLFLRFSRAATTDVQLALWVTVANAFLALAVLRRRAWPGYLGAGAALGLAFMSKGPVAFVQTLVPFIAFVAWRRFAGAPSDDDQHTMPPDYAARGDADRPAPVRHTLPLVAGLVVMLAVGLPWYLVVVGLQPDIGKAWWVEVTRVGATQLPPDPWYYYFTFFPWMLPWTTWLIAGLWVAGAQAFQPRKVTGEDAELRDGSVLALFLALAPVLVMSCFKDKTERYLLPMVAPAAVVATRAAVAWWRRPTSDTGGRAADAVHWVTLALLALGLPLVGVLAPRLDLGDRWFSPVTAAGFALGAAAILVVGYVVYRRRGAAGAVAPVAATALLMLLLQYPFLLGYRVMDRSDLKPLADAVWAQYPDADVHQFEPGHRTRVRMDLPIYLGRVTRTIGRDDLARITATEKPQVVVFLERRGHEQELGPPWQEFGTGGGRKGGWRAYVLPPTAR
jgi:4-amino-4-deoxy-L-arabinose transferase-like glycosyltransferase